MKNLKLFLSFLTVCAVALFTSCKEEPKTGAKPELVVIQKELSIPTEGGDFSLYYEVKNPLKNGKLQYECAAEWIHDFDLSEANRLKFKVDANQAQEPREAKLTMEYPDAGSPVEIVIRQNGVGIPDFVIKLGDPMETSVSIVVSPNDEKVEYTVGAISKKDYETLGSDEELFNRIVKDFEEFASNYGYSLEDYLINSDMLKMGEYESSLRGLNPETEYYAYAVGMNISGERTTGLVKTAFTTKSVEMKEASFDIAYEIKGKSVTMSVTPSDNEVLYYFSTLAKEYVGEGKDALRQVAQSMLDEEIYYGQMYGMTMEEILASMRTSGKKSANMNLAYNTTYVGYAFALNDNGVICSEISSSEFTTGNVEKSENVITLGVSNVSVNRVYISVSTTNDDPYVIFVEKRANYEGMSDDEIIKALLKKAVATTPRTGNLESTVANLDADTEYAVYAFGYEANTNTTDLAWAEFTTLVPGNPEEVKVEFKIDNITFMGAEIQTFATPETSLYYWYVAPVESTADEILKGIYDMIDGYVQQGFFKNRADYMQRIGSRGNEISFYNELQAETEYKAYAFGVYEDTGEPATEMMFSEPFKTKSNEVSKETISVISDKYYDGIEVSKKYPQYAGAEGGVVVELEAEISEGVVDYYYHVFQGDITDPNQQGSSDMDCIKTLLTQGLKNEKKVHLSCYYERDITILAVAIDTEGRFSKVFRKKIRFTKDGVSDISGFQPMYAPSAPERVVQKFGK